MPPDQQRAIANARHLMMSGATDARTQAGRALRTLATAPCSWSPWQTGQITQAKQALRQCATAADASLACSSLLEALTKEPPRQRPALEV
jgi:hypothetical protein